MIAEAQHSRYLVALVVLGSTSAALLGYLFKVKALEAIGNGDELLRFFASYYAAISLLIRAANRFEFVSRTTKSTLPNLPPTPPL